MIKYPCPARSGFAPLTDAEAMERICFTTASTNTSTATVPAVVSTSARFAARNFSSGYSTMDAWPLSLSKTTFIQISTRMAPNSYSSTDMPLAIPPKRIGISRKTSARLTIRKFVGIHSPNRPHNLAELSFRNSSGLLMQVVGRTHSQVKSPHSTEIGSQFCAN